MENLKNVERILKEKNLLYEWKEGEKWLKLKGFCDTYGFTGVKFFSEFKKYKIENNWGSMYILGILMIKFEDFVDYYKIKMDKDKDGLKPLWLLVNPPK